MTVNEVHENTYAVLNWQGHQMLLCRREFYQYFIINRVSWRKLDQHGGVEIILLYCIYFLISICICKRVAYRNTIRGVRKSVAPSPRPLSPPRLAAIGIAPHKCAKYSSREYKLHHGCNFSRVTGPKGNFWGCYMTLLGLISQERNRNLNVA